MVKLSSVPSPAVRHPAARRGAVIAAITMLAWVFALGLSAWAPAAAARANDFFYDLFYRLRGEQDMRQADVLLVTADQASLDAVSQRFDFGWPWPREFWGQIAAFAADSGARAVAFDIVFQEPSIYQKLTGDDSNFADAINGLKIPVVFGATAKAAPREFWRQLWEGRLGSAAALGRGEWEKFAPPVHAPIFGAVNVGDDKVYRWYRPWVYGLPSLMVSTVQSTGGDARVDAPFRLHYYGPHLRKDGQTTFTYLSAAAVLGAQIDGPEAAKTYGISRELFKGKIVILCATALGTYDLKSSPLSDEYPGPEVQATAIENLLRGDRVIPIAPAVAAILSLVAALFVSVGIIIPRQAGVKLAAPLGLAALFFVIAIVLFRGTPIRWLPPLQTLAAIVAATPLAFAWTYFAEDRQRRFMLQALSKVVSPAIADELARNPERLARGTIRTELTLLFTDLANFTGLSEHMDVQALGTFMNRYLGEMSNQVFSQNGTLDKYIGDAVMAFWNAPVPQADHALRACKAALQMVAREKELHGAVAGESAADDAARKLFTRIGINTAPVAVGFIGSEHLFNYTALGDGVNLASRLEGANKLYGTRILLSAHTAALVEKDCDLRQVDILRVKGKTQPMAVFELLGLKESGGGRAELAADYAAAFAAYQAQQWDRAASLLLELSGRFAQDGPTHMLLARVQEFQKNPPDPHWDGVYVSDSK